MSIEVGQIVEGKITSITSFGAFVSLENNVSGMVHISEVSNTYVKNIAEFLKVGQSVKVKVCGIGDGGKIALSIKQIEEKKQDNESAKKTNKPVKIESSKLEKKDDFEDMISKFMKSSDDKLFDLKKAMDNKRGSSGFSRKNAKKY